MQKEIEKNKGLQLEVSSNKAPHAGHQPRGNGFSR